MDQRSASTSGDPERPVNVARAGRSHNGPLRWFPRFTRSAGWLVRPMRCP